MTPKHAKSNKELKEINSRISELESAIEKLKLDRAGRIMWSDDDSPLDAWCVVCGNSTVDVEGGMDTCRNCNP